MTATSLSLNKYELIASICRDSFEEFVRCFWHCVPGAGKLKWNWHLSLFCEEFENIVRRVVAGLPKENDLIFNEPPGTSKSTVFSILGPAWGWTIAPWLRFMSASNSDNLVTDLSSKSRDVIRSELYQKCFPEIQFREAQDAKGYFANTLGGDRFTCTVAGKSPIGFHYHICFPWETLITTELGELPIGKVVDEKMLVRVLSFDHSTMKLTWKPIESYQVNPVKPLCRITLSDGSFMEPTEDHPIYVIGKGYVAATNLAEGDRVIHASRLSGMRGMASEGEMHIPSEQETGGQVDPLLHVPVLRGASEKDQFSSVQLVRRDGLSESGTCQKSKDVVLQSQVLCGLYGGRKSSPIQQQDSGMRRMRQGNTSATLSRGGESVLQYEVPWEGDKRGQSSEKTAALQETVRSLRRGGSGIAHEAIEYGAGDLLFADMCEQGAFKADEGGGEFQLFARGIELSVFDGVFEQFEKEDTEERKGVLFSVRQDAGGEWRQEIGHSSHRLFKNQSRQDQSRGYVQVLSRNVSRQEAEETFAKSELAVTRVEQAVRIPSATYNIGVLESHNYFAAKILVHNCIVDDPIDPKRMNSKADVQTAREFMTNVLPSRKLDKMVSAMILVMQRLGVGDPTDVVLEESKKEGAAKVRHICLPSDLVKGDDGVYVESDVIPQELAKRYIDGLLDPVRLGTDAIIEARSRGAHYYDTQFRQKPFNKSGGMFKEKYFLKRAKAAPFKAKRAVFWDRAFSNNDDSCRTAGTVMAWDGENVYVGPVRVGRWMPDERDDQIVGLAQQCRDRFTEGANEPTHIIEVEPAAGEDSYRYLAKKLAGFKVVGEKAKGNKEQRAQPWASQLAAGNVYVVEEGWVGCTIQEWIDEHCAFPNAELKDLVDSAGGAFNWLFRRRQDGGNVVQSRTIRLGKREGPRILFMDAVESTQVVIEEPTLLVHILSPGREEEIPHGLNKCLGQVSIQFVDVDPADHQQSWDAPVSPYGLSCERIMAKPEHAKAMWECLLKSHSPSKSEVIMVVDDSDGKRAQSAAMAICDAMGLPRPLHLSRPDEAWVAGKTDSPPNRHVYETLKKGRWSVSSR